MSKILGLDLGTNSIGWALIDDKNHKILGMGSRIFPMGVVNLGDGEKEMSKNASRTENRSKRKQFFRKRLRKKKLLKFLTEHKMCPLSKADIEQWRAKSDFPEDKLKDWFRLNPYVLREKGLREELTNYELGRVFYHIIQRRGFQSNSRSVGTDDGAIYDGKENKIGILQTAESIGNSTLGQYLNSIAPKEFEPFKYGRERIRNRYTTRKMYIDEFEKLWDVQSKFNSQLTPQLKEDLGGRKKEGYSKDGILFFQKPLKSQKGKVGKCTFEQDKSKAPISSIEADLFRIYQWVNTVEVNSRRLNEDERRTVLDQLLKKEKMKFSSIRKALKMMGEEFQFNYNDQDSIVGTHTISKLSSKKFFGKEWFNFSEKEQEDIWHVLYFFKDRDKLKAYAMNKWGFDEKKADDISKFNLKQGYASLSRKAMRNILPFLKMGFHYDIAVAFGGVKNVFGDLWDELKDFELELIDTHVPDIVRSNTKGGYIKPLKEFIAKEFKYVDEKRLNKLYHHSSTINSGELLKKLPVSVEADKEIQNLRNPVVIAALFEVRRLVNELIDDFGPLDEIKIEMARELKASKTKRNEQKRKQKWLERENDRIKKLIEGQNQRVTHENILKYKLWEECNQTCPYTGKPISIIQLFSGEVQIEHIHPWARSLNDSFMNKTLCFADENRKKGNRTPYEFYASQGEKKWEAVKEQALSCFKNKKNYPDAYHKFKHFIKKKHNDDFVSRQLNDTRFISREAKNYLSKVCKKVGVLPGQATAILRHYWGLNTILNGENKKSREDHRHHAIDALVVACSTAGMLNELSKWNAHDQNYQLKEFPMPWSDFRKQAEITVQGILVSHKIHNPVLTVRNVRTVKNGNVFVNKSIAARGELHKETVYGKRIDPYTYKMHFHVRKPVESLTTKTHIDKIVDHKIQKLITQRIDSLGGYVKGKDVPKNTFFDTDDNGQVQPQIFLPNNKKGDPVPILKVRMKETLNGAVPLNENETAFVNPRNNHHALIYEDFEGKLKEDIVTFWTAVERKKQGEKVYQLPPDGKKIVTILEANDLFVLGLSEDDLTDRSLVNKHLYRVQKISSGDYFFRLHNAATILNKDEEKRIASLKKFAENKPIKVKITTTGKLQKIDRS